MNKRSPSHHIKQAPKKPDWFNLGKYSSIIYLEPHRLFSVIEDRLDILNCIETPPANKNQELKLQIALSKLEFIKASPLGYYKSIQSLLLCLALKKLKLADLADLKNHTQNDDKTIVREVKNGVIFSLNDAVIPLKEDDYFELESFFDGINTTPKQIDDNWIFDPIDNSIESFLTNYKQHIKVDLHQPEKKILNDFKKWLDVAKAELKPSTPKRENFELYRNGLARHRVIEYLDLAIYEKLERRNITGPVISKWLEIDIKQLEVTRSKVKAIKDPKFLEWFKGFSEHIPL